MKFLKIDKGTFGYINKKRVIEIIKTIIMFAGAIGLYLIGYLTLKTNKSIWTILAVLSVLPAAKSAVSMIMFIRFSSITEETFNKINLHEGKLPVGYEYVFTTSEKSYYVISAACCDSTIIALMDEKYNKGKKKHLAVNELKDHLVSAIQREGISNYSLKIYTNIDDYCNRLDEMNVKLEYDDNNSAYLIFRLFNALSI